MSRDSVGPGAACPQTLNRRQPRASIAPWSRGLLEKLAVSQLVKKFPAFYGTRRFITAFTTTYVS
jgi:hypothetical protein